MIANLIVGFISILIGVSLIVPIAKQVNTVGGSTNATGGACLSTETAGSSYCQVFLSSSWGATVLQLVPGFFALGILGIGIAVTYSSLRQAGVV